jgi:hypothetical protein
VLLSGFSGRCKKPFGFAAGKPLAYPSKTWFFDGLKGAKAPFLMPGIQRAGYIKDFAPERPKNPKARCILHPMKILQNPHFSPIAGILPPAPSYAFKW